MFASARQGLSGMGMALVPLLGNAVLAAGLSAAQLAAVLLVVYAWYFGGVRLLPATLVPALISGWLLERTPLWAMPWVGGMILGFVLLVLSTEIHYYPWLAAGSIGRALLVFSSASAAVVVLGRFLRILPGKAPAWALAATIGLLVLLSAVWAIRAQWWPRNLSRLGKTAAFRQLHLLVSTYYPYTQTKQIDLEAAFREGWREVQRGDLSDGDFALLVAQYMAALRDAHVCVTGGGLLNRYAWRPALTLARAEGQWVVETIGDDALAATGLRPGCILTSVDGVPLKEHLAALPAFLWSAGTASFREHLLGSAMLAGSRGSSLRIGFTDLDGTGRQCDLQRTRPFGAGPVSGEFRWSRLSPTIGYVRLPSFQTANPNSARFFEQALSDLRDTEALILDVRDNGGGNEAMALRINSHLFPCRVAYGRFVSARLPQERRNTVVYPSRRVYRGRLVILVDEGCFSTCAGFLTPHVLRRRGILVGRPTGGGGGDPSRGVVLLPGGVRVRFPLAAFLDANGSSAQETEGILPDILVERTIRSTREGTDLFLEKALDALRARAETRVRETGSRPKSSLRDNWKN